jgi:hypothetical protein
MSWVNFSRTAVVSQRLRNTHHAALIEQVRLRLPSNVSMGAVTLDGEHRTLMTNTAQARARSIVDKATNSGGEIDQIFAGGGVDPPDDGGGNGDGDDDDDDAAFASPPTQYGRSKLGQAKEVVGLCSRIITLTLRSPLQRPVVAGNLAPYSSKPPSEHGDDSEGEIEITARSKGAVAEVQGLGRRFVRCRLNGVHIEPPLLSTLAPIHMCDNADAGGGGLPVLTLPTPIPMSSPMRDDADAADDDNDYDDSPPRPDRRVPGEFSMAKWLRSHADEANQSFEQAQKMYEAEVKRNPDEILSLPKHFAMASDRDAYVAKANPEYATWVNAINTGVTRPLVDVQEIPSLAWVEVGGSDEQPDAAKKMMFLSASVSGQLTYVEKMRLQAENYMLPAQKLEDARGKGEEPLSKKKLPELKTLISTHKCKCSGKKVDLITCLMAHSKKVRDRELTLDEKNLERLVDLEEALRQLPSWKPEMTVASLRHHAANAEFSFLQQDVLREGFVNPRPKEGEAFYFYDVYHLLHNMVIGIIFGNENENRGVLDIEKIRAAAVAVGCPILISIVYQKVDKHSHMATHFFLTNEALIAQLRQAGHLQDAVILETLGRAAIAWLRPGKTELWRTNALLACNLLILRLFGRAMRDVDGIRGNKRQQLGFTCNQLVDLLAINEARSQYLERMSPAERAAFKETAVTTRYVESYFSRLSANKGSGEKLTQHEIQGVVKKLDAILVLLRTADKGSTIPESSRKRKFVEGADEEWNNGQFLDEEDLKFVKDMRKRVMGYVSGRTSIRQHNAKYKK